MPDSVEQETRGMGMFESGLCQSSKQGIGIMTREQAELIHAVGPTANLWYCRLTAGQIINLPENELCSYCENRRG